MSKRRRRADAPGRIPLRIRLAAAFVLAVILFPVFAVCTSAAPVVSEVRMRVDNEATQVSVGVTEPVSYRVFTLSGPDRVVIDMADARWGDQSPSSSAAAPAGVVQRVRHGRYQPGTLRLVIDCTAAVQVLDVALIRADAGYRLKVSLSAISAGAAARPAGNATVVEVAGAEIAAPAPVPIADAATAGAAEPSLAGGGAAMDPVIGATEFAIGDIGPQARSFLPAATSADGAALEERATGILLAVATRPAFAPPVPRPSRPARGLAPIPAPAWVVAVDAGHGGRDPGATGISGVQEKQITLAMARLLRDELRATGRYKVILTRNRDVFIPLRDRIAIARTAGADLFLSLHADKMPNSAVRGLSVYTLSERSSDAEAAALADRENKADLIAGIDFAGQSPEVTGILIGLAQRETMNESVRFAELLTSELRDDTILLPRAHRFAGFAVLKAPDVPSVLVELGYLSNLRDESLLGSPEHRRQLARSIARAIDAYFVRIEARNRP